MAKRLCETMEALGPDELKGVPWEEMLRAERNWYIRAVDALLAEASVAKAALEELALLEPQNR